MNKLLYVYEDRIPEKLRELVRTAIPREEFQITELTYSAPETEWVEKLKANDVVLFAPGRFVPDHVLEHAKHIKLMQLWSSGYDKFNLAGCTRLGIPVANNGGANACSVAEHAVMLMLATSRKLPDCHERTVTGHWAGNSNGLDMFLMAEKTVGIIGFGNIGRFVAKKLSGFDMHVKYFDPKRATPEVEKELRAEYVSMEDLLATSDIITLHLHNTKETQNIIGQSEFALMKEGSLLINVSRAQLVDQEALVAALTSGRLRAAGVDVYMQEPTTGDEPLLKLPNVVATPHTAGSTFDTYSMVMRRAVQNFRTVARGEEAQWLINKEE